MPAKRPSAPLPHSHRKPAAGLAPAGGRLAPPIVEEVLRGPAQALDPAARADLEGRLGHDFSRVRVHA
ncbi:MAG: DUF4157 domain-containing protein, partial [Chloroflexi bacterium]|nr:DUF4157 domain-containing protein [Chloroflexota bacterium]